MTNMMIPGNPSLLAGWNRPASFNDIPLPPFPSNLLPPTVRDYVEAVALSLEVPVDMPAIAALTTVAVSVQGRFDIDGKPGWREQLGLYSLIIAAPSEMKSQSHRSLTDFLTEYEREYNRKNQHLIAQYDVQKRLLEKEIKVLEDKVFKGNGGVSQQDVVNKQLFLDNLPKHTLLRLMTNDVTPESLATIMNDNHGRMAVVSAESGVFDTIAGRYSNRVPNLDTFLKAYTGDGIQIDRQGKPPILVDFPVLSMLLMGQPDVLESIMGNNAFRGRGLNSRFLYSIPESKIGHRTMTTPPVPTTTRTQCRDLIFELLDLSMQSTREVLRLSPDAFQAMTNFRKSLEPRLRGENADLEDIGDWAGKYHGTVLRLAGLLHVMERRGASAQTEVSERTMLDAISLGDYFLQHALAAYQLMGADKFTQDVKYILRQLKRNYHDSISRRDLFRLCRGRFKKTDDLDPALDMLVEFEYLHEVVISAKSIGRKPSRTFEVNPYLYENCPNSPIGATTVLEDDEELTL